MRPSAESMSASLARRLPFIVLALVPSVLLAGFVSAAAREAFRGGPFLLFWLAALGFSASLLALLLSLSASEIRRPRPAGRVLTTLLIAFALVELALISAVIPIAIVAGPDIVPPVVSEALAVVFATLGLFVLAAVLVCHEGLRTPAGRFAQILGFVTGVPAVFFAHWLVWGLLFGWGLI